MREDGCTMYWNHVSKTLSKALLIDAAELVGFPKEGLPQGGEPATDWSFMG